MRLTYAPSSVCRSSPLILKLCNDSKTFRVALKSSLPMILSVCMPRKIRQLIAELEKHGFVDRGGKGSHRNFLHPSGVRITLSGAPRDDAKHYQSEISNERFERYSDDQKQTL